MHVSFEDFGLDVERRELTRGSVPISVGPQVFDLLVYLVKNRERVVSKDDLIEAVWSGRIVSESTMTSHINAVRKAVGDSGEDQRLIRTIARKGFRFVGDIRAPSQGHNGEEAAAPTVRAVSALSLPEKPSIAVLAFRNMSGDPEQEHFGDGIGEDIITALSKSRWLFVIARNSSFAYKGRSVDIKQISRELGVRFVLEGSVRKSGARVRITAQLIEAVTGAHLWAERYDRDLTDIFEVQDEITQNVAAAIEPAMAQAERQRVSRKPPDSLDAWEAYHRGLWHFLNQEPSENQLAKEFFQRAINLDAVFAAGHYALALCSVWDGWVYASRPMEGCLVMARPFAQRALALDDADSMSHFVMGFVLHMEGDITGGRSEYERAINLNPSHAWAVGALGGLHANDGHPDEALAALSKAMRASPHDPLTWIWMLWVAAAHFYAGTFQAAVDAADRLIRFRPDKSNAYRFKAAALGQLGQIEEACTALNKAIEVSPQNFDYFVRKRPKWMRAVDHNLQIEGLKKAGLSEI